MWCVPIVLGGGRRPVPACVSLYLGCLRVPEKGKLVPHSMTWLREQGGGHHPHMT